MKIVVHQKSGLSPLLLGIAMDVITENAREESINKILFANDLVLISESVDNL